MYSDIKAKKKRWSLPQRSAACAVVQHMKAEAGFVLSRPQAKMRPPAALLPPAISGPGCKVQAGAALPWPLPIPLPGRKVLVLSFLLFNCTCTYVYFPIKGIVVYVKHHSWLKKCPLPTFLSEVLPFFFSSKLMLVFTLLVVVTQPDHFMMVPRKHFGRKSQAASKPVAGAQSSHCTEAMASTSRCVLEDECIEPQEM